LKTAKDTSNRAPRSIIPEEVVIRYSKRAGGNTCRVLNNGVCSVINPVKLGETKRDVREYAHDTYGKEGLRSDVDNTVVNTEPTCTWLKR